MESYFAGIRIVKYLLGVLIVLVVGDGLVSYFLVRSGLGREGNPLLQTWVGKEEFLVIKLLGALLCALILWDMYKRWSKLALISIWCLVVLHAGIVLWNLSVFFACSI